MDGASPVTMDTLLADVEKAGGLPPEKMREKNEGLLAERKANSEREVGAIEWGARQRDTLMNKMPPIPPAPKLQDPPKAPQQKYSDPMVAANSPAMLLAAIASVFTRRPLTTALNAAAASMEAYHAGDKEKLELERHNWKDNMEAVLKQNQKELDQYNAVLNNRNLSVKDILAEIQVIAASVGDEQKIAIIRNGDVEAAYKMVQDQQKIADDLALKFELAKSRFGDQSASTQVSDQALNFMAEQVLAGDKTPLQNLGRYKGGQQLRVKLMERVNELAAERNIDGRKLAKIFQEFNAYGAGLNSEARTAGSRAANLQMILGTIEEAVPQALEMSEKIARTNWVSINKLVQMAETQISDPALKQFRLANIQLAELWAKAMNPTGVMRNEDRALALSILDVADGPRAYKAAVESLIQAVKREKTAVDKFRGRAGKDEEPTIAPELPLEARSALKEGVITTFKNGQTWTLRKGVPVQVPGAQPTPAPAEAPGPDL